MPASLKQFLAAPKYAEDAERSAQARLFDVVAAAALAALGVAVVSQLFLSQSGVPLAVTLAALVVIAAMTAVARRGHLGLACTLLPPIMLIGCMMVVVVRDGLHDNAVMAIGAVLVMGGVLLQRRALAAFAATAVILVYAVGYAEITGKLQTRLSGFTEWRHVVGLSLFLLFIAVTVRALMDSMLRSLREVRQSEARFVRAVETMAEGVILLDMAGEVRMCNQAAERILGVPEADILRLGMPIGGLNVVRADGSPFPPEERPVRITLRTGQSRTGVVMGVVREGGSVHWISVNSAALFAEDAVTPYAVLTTFFDISGLKRAEQALRIHAEQLRHLSHRLFEVEENERRRLAREMHDRIGANLAALGLNLRLLRGEWQKSSTRLDDSERLLDSTAQLVRDVLSDMRPPGLEELGLLAALREHAQQVAQRSGFALEVRGVEPQPRLPAATEIALFRVAQEALTNIVKHARASAVTILLAAERDRVTLAIADDGVGFDGAAQGAALAGRGMGMASMHERAEAVGARQRIESAPGRGTRVTVEVPRVVALQEAPAQV